MDSQGKISNSVSVLCTLFVAAAMASAQTAATAGQPQFVYVNDQVPHGNRVEGFSISPAGVATPLPGSPYATGRDGSGVGLGYFPSRDTALRTGSPPILYVTDGTAGDITYFSINPSTGRLKASGVHYNVTVSPPAQVNLAVTPDGKYLFFYSGSCDEIFGCLGAFSIAPNGALTQLPVEEFPPLGVVADLVITPDGKFLMASGLTSGIAVYAIHANGSLTPVSSSPFPTAGFAEGLEIDCAGQHLFVGDSTLRGVSVEVFTIASDGSLAAIPGSPFTSSHGHDSATIRLSPSGTFLYVGNADSATVSEFHVAASGKLTKVPGSPFADGNPVGTPAQIAPSRSGTILFVADFPANLAPPALDVLRALPNGTIRPVSGSPVLLEPESVPVTVVTYPPPACNAN